MQTVIPLDRMSLSEKLLAMERIWDDLCHTQNAVPSPDWHADVLLAREQKIRAGKATFMDLDEAKRRLQEKLQ